MIHILKNYLRYTKFHFYLLRFTNPNYLKWINKEIDFHKKFLNKGNQLIFDLGANLGDKSHIFSFFSKNLILYEPEEKLVEKLKFRFKKYKEIKIKNYVVLDEIKKINFYSAEGKESHSSVIKGYLENFADSESTNIIVKQEKTTTLNHEINIHGNPYYCKIDCEGAEEKILKNLSFKINIISFETYVPNFYQNAVKIIEGIEKKFNSSFNLRKDYEYDFFLKNNVKSDQIKKILSETSGVFEVFIFTD